VITSRAAMPVSPPAENAPGLHADPADADATGDVVSWYHTLELPGGVVTPGYFDLRSQVAKLPWPDVVGKRCLDVATYDGFYAFELERRGASEVIATDIPSHHDWDWPAPLRTRGGQALAALAGEKGGGFEVAREALGSRVQKRRINVYDLRPEEVGVFDVVVCGSLLLHLRDPVRALEAIRSVCDGWFMSVEAISLLLSLAFRRRPAASLCGDDNECQWWTANRAGHRRMVEAAGFRVVEETPAFAEPFGPGHPIHLSRYRDRRSHAVRSFRRLFLGGDGVPHAALLARPLQIPPLKL
jgi:SAM-dependent methyltransferase